MEDVAGVKSCLGQSGILKEAFIYLFICFLSTTRVFVLEIHFGASLPDAVFNSSQLSAARCHLGGKDAGIWRSLLVVSS